MIRGLASALPSTIVLLRASAIGRFRQGVGVLHVWTARVCLSNDILCGAASYHGLVPQTQFMVKARALRVWGASAGAFRTA